MTHLDGSSDGLVPASVDDPHLGWSRLVYWFVLAVAAAVDAANFQGIVAIVMREAAEPVTWTVVGGFTVLALALSHQVGAQARAQIEQRHHPLRGAVGWLAFVAWFGMGLFAFAVRYRGRESTFLGGAGGGSGDILNAGMFLTFYLATGLIAGLAGYHRPSAGAERSRRVAVEERRLSDQLAVVVGQLAEASAMLAALDSRRSRRAEELRLELAAPGADELAAIRAYHADLAHLEQQEMRFRNDLGRLEHTAQWITARLRALGLEVPGRINGLDQ